MIESDLKIASPLSSALYWKIGLPIGSVFIDVNEEEMKMKKKWTFSVVRPQA